MTVNKILNEKGREVVTIGPSSTLAEAARILAERRIGAIVVVGEDGRIAGILSERDVVRMIGTTGPSCLDVPIDEVMTRKVITCGEETTLNEVMEIMTRGRFRHIPVAADGRLIGLVSIGDVVKRRIEDVEREADDMRSYIAAAG